MIPTTKTQEYTQAIWKYTTPLTFGMKEILIPKEAHFLTIDKQGEDLAIWCLIGLIEGSPQSGKSKIFRINVVDTGSPLDIDFASGERHYKTIVTDVLVYHIFIQEER